jgi:hypothetical protein
MAYMPKGRGFGLMNINKNKLVFTREPKRANSSKISKVLEL